MCYNRQDKKYIYGHGVCDNSAGITGLLTTISLIKKYNISFPHNLIFAFTIGEEGLGAKRGMKQVIKDYGRQIDAVVNAESHPIGRVTNQAIGQYRCELSIDTKLGGHSFRDFGRPNAIVLLSQIISDFSHANLPQSKGKTTFNVGSIKGEGSINAIPRISSCLLEIRSENKSYLGKSKNKFLSILDKYRNQFHDVEIKVKLLAETIPAIFPTNHRIYKLTMDVQKKLGIKSKINSGNTDGDVSLAANIPTVTIGTSLVTYNDEPKIYTYGAYYAKNGKSASDSSSGTSFNQNRALVKVMGEAIERYCLDTVNGKKLITASVSELHSSYLDPFTIPSFSQKQTSDKLFKQFTISRNTKFRWIEGYSYIGKKTILLPAQLVFTNYKHLPNEPYIRFPVSTGGAAHTSLESALYRGICEVVERDSFMIYYLNKMSPLKIDIPAIKDLELKNIVNILGRYKLELAVFDISTDLEIPVYAAVLFDKTGKGPAVSLGLKAGFDAIDGVIGAIEEALMTRVWIRDEFIYKNKEFILPQKIETMSHRAYFWLKTEMIQYLDFLFKDHTFKKIDRFNHKSEKTKLHTVVELLEKARLNIYYVDITQRKIKEAGFTVVKVFIPALYPVYFDEKYPYLGIPRLYEVPVKLGFLEKPNSEDNLNQIPHPFL